jgi:hypothetical protein
MMVPFQWLFAAFILLTAFASCGSYVVMKPKEIVESYRRGFSGMPRRGRILLHQVGR